MPKITSLAYKKFHEDKVIDLISPDKLEEYISTIKEKRLPKKGSVEMVKALLILLYYTGARPEEVIDLTAEDFNEKKISKSRNAYEITIKTLKRGERKRVLPIPKNRQTEVMYNYVKRNPPGIYVFHAFRSNNQNKVHWLHKKEMLIKEGDNISIKPYIQNKQKIYPRASLKICKYIKLYTGLPPYFFRHNRFSIMADKGATDMQIQFFKGAKSPASVQPYKNLSTRAHKELLKFFNS